MSVHVEHDGEAVRLTFRTWDAAGYELFLRTKGLPEHRLTYDEIADAYMIETPARFARMLGVEAPIDAREWLPLPAHLWDYQRFLVRTALGAKRYALWADTGLGKTPMWLEWARQVQARTSGRVLAVVPLSLIAEAVRMAGEFYGDSLALHVLDSREGMIAWCRDGAPGIAITNPEKFIPRDGQEVIPEITYLAGVVLDESSLLKTGGGKIKWALIKSCRGVEFKLSCTATPAPNDPIEYASQAAWLEKIRDEGEVIWTYFVRTADGDWTIKDHALPAFYRFLSGWSCYLRSPAVYGFADNLRSIPEPVRMVHEVPATAAQLEAASHVPDATGQRSMFGAERMGVVERGRLGQLSSGFEYVDGRGVRVESDKGARIAEIVATDTAEGLRVLVWTAYDETAVIVREALEARGVTGVETLIGQVPVAERAAMVERFRSGDTRVLITRPRLLGFGFNLQAAGSMVFADITDSYEQAYQAERRAYRYGQTQAVRIHYVIVPELQGVVWRNLEAKRAQFLGDVTTMERLYVEALQHTRQAEVR